MKKVFIDGRAGTTGLKIEARLAERTDVALLTLPEELHRDTAARKAILNEADIAFLCLPDDAARESVSLIENPGTIVLDTSTAHRTAPGWAYGFPELSAGHLEKIQTSKRIAVPGCHASGFIALIYPLIEAGLLPPDARLSCFSLTGYSGGGKKMISAYESAEADPLFRAPRQYGLSQNHKHLPEMKLIAGLSAAPVFCPVVDDFYSGMAVTVPLHRDQLFPGKNADSLRAVYAEKYRGPVVRYSETGDESGFLSAAKFSETDGMEIGVFGDAERIVLSARYDNLGKGASGAAIECMNLILGEAPEKGLVLKK